MTTPRHERTDSSRSLRDQLLRDYCIVPEVKSSIPLNSYLSLARQLYESAISSFHCSDLNLTYVYLKKMLIILVDKLPSHPSYRGPSTAHKNLINSAFTLLENVVSFMDENEDLRLLTQLSEEDKLLSDEFDGDENDAHFSVVIPHAVDASENWCNTTPSAPVFKPQENISNKSTLLSKALEYLKCYDEQNNEYYGAVEYPNDIKSFNLNPSYSTDPQTPFPDAPSTIGPASTIFTFQDTQTFKYAGVSTADLEILQRIRINQFPIPPPTTTRFDVKIPQLLRSTLFSFHRDDFHVSFSSFLLSIPTELQMTKSAIEANRCFFVHLGVAMQIHPFALQTACRNVCAQLLQKNSLPAAPQSQTLSQPPLTRKASEVFAPDSLVAELAPSVLQYAGFVDANVLSYLWFEEFRGSVICVISGNTSSPIFSCFYEKGADRENLRDVIIHCNGSHFTLLRPFAPNNVTAFKVLPALLKAAKSANFLVMENEVDPINRSVESVIRDLLR